MLLPLQLNLSGGTPPPPPVRLYPTRILAAVSAPATESAPRILAVVGGRTTAQVGPH